MNWLLPLPAPLDNMSLPVIESIVAVTYLLLAEKTSCLLVFGLRYFWLLAGVALLTSLVARSPRGRRCSRLLITLSCRFHFKPAARFNQTH